MYYKKTKDWRKQQMSEYRIIYISDEDGGEVEGCGYTATMVMMRSETSWDLPAAS